MIDIQKATAIALDRIATRYKHPDHDRTVALRKAYTAFMTGEGLDDRMRRFKRRESESDFDQRKALTIHITKAITSALMVPERKLVNVKPVIDSISYGTENDTKAKGLRELCSEFYGGRDIDHYFSTLVDSAEADPNAFIVLAFENFDFRYEKPITYPFKVPCDNVWDFQYFNGRLQYLWTHFVVQYIVEEARIDPVTKRLGKPKTKEGDRFVLYVDDHHVVFEQVKATMIPSMTEGALMTADGAVFLVTSDTSVTYGTTQPTYFYRKDKETLYSVTFYNQKSGQVPALRLGCKQDTGTDGRTCVNMWDQGVPFLDKVLMRTSELDITVALHTFPRLLQYGPPCTECGGTREDANGVSCGGCEGTGMKTTHTTGMDHMLFPLPKRVEDIKDLSSFLHYPDAPVELIKIMMEIEKDAKDSAIRAVYGSDLYVKNTVASTATEKVIEQQSIYDTLQPRASWWSESRITTTKVVAAYNDQSEGLKVVHRFPRNLKFETVGELLLIRKSAEEAGTDAATLVAMDKDIRENVLVDDPEAAKMAETKARFNPFLGKSESERLALIAGGFALERSVLMYVESATIFKKAEKEYEGKPVGFYDLDQAKQDDVIEKIVEAMLAERTEEKEAAMEAFQLGTDPNSVDDDAVKDEEKGGEEDPAQEKIAA